MLDIQVHIKGNKVVLNKLQRLAAQMPQAIGRGLVRVAKGVHRVAHDFLSGSGSKKSGVGPGGYPVPVRTGHLRRMLDWLRPGESKAGESGVFTAGVNEVVIYDSAIYSRAIHEGFGSSGKHGKRPYLTDALEKFNRGARIRKTIEEEIRKEIRQGD